MATPDDAGLDDQVGGNSMKTPIKIVRVIARMNVGGPAWQVSVLTRLLDEPEFSSLLVVGDVGEGEADFIRLRAPGLPHIRIEGLGRSVKPWSDFVALVRLVKILRQVKPDIVHTHTAKAGVIGRIAALLAGVPHRVHTFHGHLLHGYFSAPKTKLIVLTERILARCTDVIAAVGTQVRDDLLAAGVGRADQYSVVPPGVAEFEPIDRVGARQMLGIDQDAVTITFIGRLTAIKRPDRLIEAFRLVATHEQHATLLVVGDGELLDETMTAASDLGERVRFLGWRSDLDVILSASDIAVLTSDNEGMPVTMIEASMAGVPCVTTDVGSAREVVSDGITGMVVATDAVDVARALEVLVHDDRLRVDMGREAARLARERFGEPRLANDYAQIYKRLTGRLT